MAESFRVEVARTGKIRKIQDVEPTPAARQFWELSDAIWQRKMPGILGTNVAIATVIPPIEARNELNDILGTFDRRLIVPNDTKPLELKGTYPDEAVELSPEDFESPKRAGVMTINWDESNVTRIAEIDGQEEGVILLDGRHDRFRELSIGFHYGNGLSLSYSMQRIQYQQDQRTRLYPNCHYMPFAEQGYLGTYLRSKELSDTQEMTMLAFLARVAGIELTPVE